jgi:hypothetical protein
VQQEQLHLSRVAQHHWSQHEESFMTSKIAVALLSAALIGTPAVVFAQTTIQQDVQKRRQDNRTIDTQKNSAEGAGTQSQSGTTGAAPGSNSGTSGAAGSQGGTGGSGAGAAGGGSGSGAGAGGAGSGKN